MDIADPGARAKGWWVEADSGLLPWTAAALACSSARGRARADRGSSLSGTVPLHHFSMSNGLIDHPDCKHRCWWSNTDPVYVAYHDTEWGVPEYDSRALFEKLILDGFQAGLSWITILRKRENFRRAFASFEPAAIARFDPTRVDALMRDTGIVRNRAKIESTIASAQAWLAIEDREGFSAFLWNFVDGRPLQPHRHTRADVPAQTELSLRISKALKAEGFNFCGPTIVYAFMQAVGMTNDHLVGCFRHAECAALGKRA